MRSTAASDINHPRQLLLLWADEAAAIRRNLDGLPPESTTRAVMAATANTVDHCWEQLRNRLLWSGMLDP